MEDSESFFKFSTVPDNFGIEVTSTPFATSIPPNSFPLTSTTPSKVTTAPFTKIPASPPVAVIFFKTTFDAP